jgi:D-lactate dehydrogenase
MRTVVFSTKEYDRRTFVDRNDFHGYGHELVFQEARLTIETAPLVDGFSAVCGFVNDVFDALVLEELAAKEVRLVALRSAGFNNLDLRAAGRCGITACRVPAYSPQSVAEFTVGLIISLTRSIHRAYMRTRANNFTLEGLLGFNLHGRTIGVIGTGRIGALVARTMAAGFGCRVLAHDVMQDRELLALGIEYVDLSRLISESHVITLHCPLTPTTHHLIDGTRVAAMGSGTLLVNTSRGGLIDTDAVLSGLISGHLGGLAIDFYEQEADLFFEDLSNEIVRDETIQRLLMFPNVLVTSHQAYFTLEALTAIADTTLASLAAFERGEPLKSEVTQALIASA